MLLDNTFTTCMLASSPAKSMGIYVHQRVQHSAHKRGHRTLTIGGTIESCAACTAPCTCACFGAISSLAFRPAVHRFWEIGVEHNVVVIVFTINGAVWVYGTCLPIKPGLIYFPIVIIPASVLFPIIFVLGSAFRSTP